LGEQRGVYSFAIVPVTFTLLPNFDMGERTD